LKELLAISTRRRRKPDAARMRTVSDFQHGGRHAQLSPKGGYRFRVKLDGDDLPGDWPDARDLEIAIKKLLDED
jgi:hypothetical protein